MASNREAYEKKFNAQLKEWSAQIALLKAKAVNATADANLDYHQAVESLQKKRDEASAKYHELKSASDDAWDDVKGGAERAWEEVKTAYHDAVSKFKS
ncbi:MAG: coiled coil domain-containing protein [Nitrospinae bacterium]|nr:coiled coil domain-containing protein [Nitrospinota bacterium]